MKFVKRAIARAARKLLRLVGEYETPLEILPNVPDIFYQYRYYATHPLLKRKPGGWEYQGRYFPDYLTVGGAGYNIFHTAHQYCSGTGIDVGAGLWPLPGATPVDIWRGPGASRKLDEFSDCSVDYLFSSHCLEHITAWQKELMRWVRLVRPDGIVFLYLPHPDCAIWNPGSPMVGDGHKWQPEPAVIKAALVECGCELVACDDGPDTMMSFFVCARKKPGV